jgi:hypothetical protein
MIIGNAFGTYHTGLYDAGSVQDDSAGLGEVAIDTSGERGGGEKA